jgi:hypothetical protein
VLFFCTRAIRRLDLLRARQNIASGFSVEVIERFNHGSEKLPQCNHRTI